MSDAEVEAQGDVDEGFDEEFEERDLNDAEPEPSQFELSDLDPKELQQLLEMDPHLPNMEDFDLGVDVLEQPRPILSPATIRNSSPFSSSPCSLYQAMVTTSPSTMTTTPTPTNVGRSLYYNDCAVENPPSVQSNHSTSTSASQTSHTSMVGESLALLNSDPDAFPDSTSEVLSLLSEGDVVSSPSYHSPPHETSPVLTTAGGLDLAETGNLLNLIELTTSLSADANIDTHSMYMFGNGTGQLNMSLSGHGTITPTASTAGGMSPTAISSAPNTVATNVITLMDSTMLPQTRASIPLARPRPTPPSTLNSYQHSNRQSASLSRTPSPSPRSPAEQELSSEDKKLVDMPYYQFRKLLDDPGVPEKRKEEVKNIRRKGRNKIAAKACRNKKLHMIMGLEKEVEQLRKAKSQIALKTKTLEKEIAELKKRCHNR